MLQLGFILFPALTQLDLTGPWDVLTRLPGVNCHLLSHDLAPVKSASGGLMLTPTMRFADAPQFDLLCVPGEPGHVATMEDADLLLFLRVQAPGCRFVTAVCTGTLVLAAAGLLRGYRATTHWTSMERLAPFGVAPVAERVVIDRDRITGAGVTAGIDFALIVARHLAGDAVAREIQLQMEYEPEPPFGGSPVTADAGTVAAIRAKSASFLAKMQAVDQRCTARLDSV